MTTWIESSGGRERGPAGLVRAWIGVLVTPHRFFRSAISTGDQAPGLMFAIAVVLLHAMPRLFIAPPTAQPLSMRVLTLLLVVLFLTPIVLHLCAALETVLLIPLVDDRAGVSQTVQVLGYAAAPCALSGVPLTALCVVGLCGASPDLIAALWLGTAVYGAVLLVFGTARIHDTSIPRAVVVTAVPSWIVFGYGFRGIHALEQLGVSGGLFG